MVNLLGTAGDTAFSGMKAQSERLKVISENMANADSIASRPGGDPYRRQIPVFQQYVDKQTGANLVKVSKVVKDPGEFEKRYMPTHPAADAKGYVSMPNVNPLVEMMDMKEAQRAYEANLSVLKTSRDMNARVLDLIK